MARSKKRQARRTRQKQGVSLIGLIETTMLANVLTQGLFRNSPVDFLIGGEGTAASGTKNITLWELFQDPKKRIWAPSAAKGGYEQSWAGVIGQNAQDNWMKMLGNFIVIPIAFRLGKTFARPAISRINRLLPKDVKRIVKV